MKVRKKAKQPQPWTPAELAWFDQQVQWVNDSLSMLDEVRRLIDAQPVPANGRMLWDGKKMHGAA